MKILFISTEALPFAKSGGLGDVVGSLPKELIRQGAEAAVMLPLYQSIKDKHLHEMEFLGSFETQLSWRNKYAGIFKLNFCGVDFYFIDNEDYFGRENYYGYFDDAERFAYYSKASLDALKILDFQPEILHCSEWQTALVPIYLKTLYREKARFNSLKTVFTIHNMEYQGQYDLGILSDVLGIDQKYKGILEYSGCINLMKGAIVTCDKLTTVSPTYAEEIEYPFYGRRLERIIKENEYKLSGILNGIDEHLFNPRFDRNIKVKYSRSSMEKKVENKVALQEELGLSEDRTIPVMAMITRLVPHKGIDLVIRVFDEIMSEHIQFVLLAEGEKQYENFFFEKTAQYPGRMAMHQGFANGLASRIYAGSDLFLMPSITEPCGLAQMIAAKYGTIPIVRATGGLKDSIIPYNPETGLGNGVTFGQINAQDMMGAIKRGISFFWSEKHRKILMMNGFKSNFSWKNGAQEYLKIYSELEK